jgi:hypothetical protein
VDSTPKCVGKGNKMPALKITSTEVKREMDLPPVFNTNGSGTN